MKFRYYGVVSIVLEYQCVALISEKEEAWVLLYTMEAIRLLTPHKYIFPSRVLYEIG